MRAVADFTAYLPEPSQGSVFDYGFSEGHSHESFSSLQTQILLLFAQPSAHYARVSVPVWREGGELNNF